MNLQEQLNRIQEMMGINEPSCDYDVLKELSNELSNKLKCDVFGSCVHFAELFVEMVNVHNDDLLYCFDVLEGYVVSSDEEGNFYRFISIVALGHAFYFGKGVALIA